MKIELKYLLNKKDISLKYFCDLNNITSYDDLVSYCDLKHYRPVSFEYYNDNMPRQKNTEKKTNVPSKKKSSPPRRSRKTPKVSKKGSASSKNNA